MALSSLNGSSGDGWGVEGHHHPAVRRREPPILEGERLELQTRTGMAVILELSLIIMMLMVAMAATMMMTMLMFMTTLVMVMIGTGVIVMVMMDRGGIIRRAEHEGWELYSNAG